MRNALVTGVVALAMCAVPGQAFGLGLGVSDPSVALANFGPGLTATGTGALVVSGVLTPWTLKASDAAHAGHLVPAAVGCTGSEAQTASGLSLSASGVLPATHSAGTVSVGSSALTVANGTVADTVNVAYSLVIGNTEVMRAGCVFSTTVTFTVQ